MTNTDSAELFLSAHTELDALIHLEHNTFAAHSGLRQSLAHATLQEAVYLHQGIESEALSCLVRLARSPDADACAYMLVQAAKLCASHGKFRALASGLLTALSAKLLFDERASVDIEIQAAAQDVLLALFDSDQAGKVQQILQQVAQNLYLPINASTPLFQDKRMVLQGALLELRFCGVEATGRSLPDDFADWVMSLKPALHEDNVSSSNFKAAREHTD